MHNADFENVAANSFSGPAEARSEYASRRHRLHGPPRIFLTGPLLIVDDVLDDANLARRATLRALPEAEVTVCGSARKAVAFLESGDVPSLILLDLRMPEMDGFAFLEWLKADNTYARIPVVVLSGLPELDCLTQAYALHARAFLVKPVTPESLRGVLASLNFAV